MDAYWSDAEWEKFLFISAAIQCLTKLSHNTISLKVQLLQAFFFIKKVEKAILQKIVGIVRREKRRPWTQRGSQTSKWTVLGQKKEKKKTLPLI